MKKSWTKDSQQILERATGLYHYNRWVASLFTQYFGKNILEIGSGLGGLSQYLPKTNITLSDIRDDYIKYLKKEFGYKTIKLDIEKEAPQSLQDSYDTIFSSNVFEHIKEDEAVFDNCFELLKKEGKLLLFVPARPEIYGSLDSSMGHYRRYTKRELIQKAKKTGFKIVVIKYVNLPGYFTWWFRGRLINQSKSDNFSAKFFDTIIVPVLYLEKLFSIPFGQSLMLIAEKP